MHRWWLTLLLLLGGCGNQVIEPIVATDDLDVCPRLAPEACDGARANGCWLQPNRLGCSAMDPQCPMGACRAGDPFVHRRDAELVLHGERYQLLGVNTYGLIGPPCEITGFGSREDTLRRLFDQLSAMRVNAVRFFAFPAQVMTSTGPDYARVDRSIAFARRAGIRLIFVLSAMVRNECGAAGTPAWIAGGYKERAPTSAFSFVDYVEALVDHYKDEPTVLAWELAHEAEADNFDALNDFVRDMSDRIRARDRNHLIIAGTTSGTNPVSSNEGGAASYYAKLHAHPNVDVIDVHNFSKDDTDGVQAVLADLQVAWALGKPAIFGATGVELTSETEAGFRQRATRMESRMTSALQIASGFLIWDYLPGWTARGLAFDDRPSDPLGGPNGTIAKHAQKLPVP